MSDLRSMLASALVRLRDESGQEVTEYSVVTFALLSGTGVSLLLFLPNAINAYRIYVGGFYMLLGLPIP
jgi:hypothetical protein